MSQWKLYVDETFNDHDFGVGVLLITTEDWRVCYALKIMLRAMNIEAEYTTLIVGLKTTK